jgi:AraC-like DNA-binding protein
VSSDGQRAPEARSGTETLVVKTFPMVAGTTFDRHSHDDHQLAWATRGVLTVHTDDATWVLPPTRALWIPAGVRHVTAASRAATMQTVYLHPGRCPVDWAAPTPVGVGALLAELIAHLGDADLDSARRARAEGVLIDLLEPLHVAAIELRMPRDPRALDVAEALVRDPACRHTLGQWGREVGASERTLARAFHAETGVSFGRWRTQLRLQSALPTLAEGGSVASASDRAGYESASAFVAAFRRETGMTPAEYFRV